MNEITFGDMVIFSKYRGYTSGIVVGFVGAIKSLPAMYLVKVDKTGDPNQGNTHNGGGTRLEWGDSSCLDNDGLWFLGRNLTVVNHEQV